MWNLCTHVLELLWVFQKLFDFIELFDGLINTSNIGKGDLAHLLVDELGAGFAKLHHASSATGHRSHQEPKQREDDYERKQ